MQEMLDDKVEEEKDQGSAGTIKPGLADESTVELKNETENGIDEKNIGKAIRFWTHPSLQDIPSQEKLAYLHKRGVSKNQIQKSWDRIAENSTNTNNPAAASAYSPSNQPSGPISRNHGNTRQTPAQQNHQDTPHGLRRNDNSNNYPYAEQSQGYQATMPQHYGGMNHQFEDDGPMSTSQGLSLVVLGSVLGLTAAAAVRWLNGGDFKLLPPPTHFEPVGCHPSGSRRMCLEEHRTLDTEGSDEFENDDEDEVAFQDDDYESEVDEEDIRDSLEFKLLDKIDSLSESLISNSGLQEKLIQKLSSQASITDHSMELLRSTKNSNSMDINDKNDETDLRVLWYKLAEIKAELSAMKRLYSGDSKEDDPAWATHLESTLTELDACLSAAKMRLGESLSLPSEQDVMMVATQKTSVTTNPQSDLASESHATTAETASANSANPEPSEDDNPEPTSCFVEKLSFQESIRRIAEEPDAAARSAGCQILYLYVVNLSGRPDNPRYRKIYTSNESFRKVENLNGARDLLYALGFEEHSSGYLEWCSGNHVGETENNNETADNKLVMQRLNEAAAALRILKSPGKSEKLVESALAVVSQESLEMESSSLHAGETLAEDTIGVVPMVHHPTTSSTDPTEVHDDECKQASNK